MTRSLRHLSAVAASLFVLLAGAAGAARAQVATVRADSSQVTLCPNHPTEPMTISIARDAGQNVFGFSVEFTLSGELALASGTSSVAAGGFLTAGNPSIVFVVTTLGPGHYVADGVTIGAPCGSAATSGTLVTVNVTGTATYGQGTLTVVNAQLRDCSNQPIPVTLGPAGTIGVDFVPPAVHVTAPDGGESFVEGNVAHATWTATDAAGLDTTGAIGIDVSTDSGASWAPLQSALDNSGATWIVLPYAVTTQARLRVTARDLNGNVGADTSDADFTLLAGTLGTPAPGATVTALLPPAPAPVREGTTLAYSLASEETVELAVYAVDGRRVRALDSGLRPAGRFRVAWDARDESGRRVAPGMYFARLSAGERRCSRALIVLP